MDIIGDGLEALEGLVLLKRKKKMFKKYLSRKFLVVIGTIFTIALGGDKVAAIVQILEAVAGSVYIIVEGLADLKSRPKG